MPLLIAAGLGVLVGGFVVGKIGGVAEDVSEATSSVTGTVIIGGAAGVTAFFLVRKFCQ